MDKMPIMAAAHAGHARSAAEPHTHREPAVALRSALGRFATGVTIVATESADGHVHCMTVNSFASLSLDPPLVMWTLRSRSARYETYSHCKMFSVSVLAESQIDLARKHARPPPSG